MRLALVADTYPPHRTSGAVQLRDLVLELVRQGHDVTVFLPSAEIDSSIVVEAYRGYEVVRIHCPRTKGVGHLRRALAEAVMPWLMRARWLASRFHARKFEGVVWYSPSIFHGPFIRAIKRASGCSSYLILRDIFPDWAVDMGLLRHPALIQWFRAVARSQYRTAEKIGVQSEGNIAYLTQADLNLARKLEVLPNWLGQEDRKECRLDLSKTHLKNRHWFLYAGNMGVAQGVEALLAMAERMADLDELGFAFVGGGSEFANLSHAARERGLKNVLFHSEISPEEVSDLARTCAAGMICLDPRHKSNNIPGKMLTYLRAGLPIVAFVNKGNDLVKFIQTNDIGVVCENGGIDTLEGQARQLFARIREGERYESRTKTAFERHFSVSIAAKKIIEGLNQA